MLGLSGIRFWRTNRRLRAELNELYLEADAPKSQELQRDRVGEGDAYVEQRIAEILRAFHAIDSGEYGSCTTCGKEIEAVTLAKDAAASSCAACSTIVYD